MGKMSSLLKEILANQPTTPEPTPEPVAERRTQQDLQGLWDQIHPPARSTLVLNLEEPPVEPFIPRSEAMRREVREAMPDTAWAYCRLDRRTGEQAVRTAMATTWHWASFGILVVGSQQTRFERAVGATVNRNNIGFSRADAAPLTEAFRRIRNEVELSDLEKRRLQARISRYARQVWEYIRTVNGLSV